MDVYNIIRQLTDQEDMISGHMQRECFNQLLPIIEYYKGWNFHEDETRFNFYPHEDYHKERYEVKINVDDNMERVEKIEALNQDIDEYNDWVNEKNELHSKELFEKAIPDGKVPDAKELNIVNPCYTIIGKHKPWLCTFIIEKPQFRNISNALDFGYLDDEEIYKLKEGMDIKEFVEFMTSYKPDINEAEYQGRKVKLGKPMQGDTKKFKVYVKNPKGNVVKVNFGQGGDAKGGTMRIRKSNPKARKSFRARHNCDNPGPRHKARYWSCRKW